jgi:hypothetical protein
MRNKDADKKNKENHMTETVRNTAQKEWPQIKGKS